MPLTTRLLTAGLAGAVLAAGATVPALGAPAPTPDRTTTTESRRVDSVATPKLAWSACYGSAECATAKLPLDYDEPKGATTDVAVLRIRATNPKAKIGTLFVNPGGPGGSGTQLALSAPRFLSESVLARFDIVGFDPRGIADSRIVRCFADPAEQARAEAGLNGIPVDAKAEAAYITSARALGKACSTTGRTLAGAMSTAEVARDMDVLRRAVGDKKLSYLGFSYGTALGQYYANMFPDRVRAVVVDGVINPVSWVGTAQTRDEIQDDRLRSADGAYKALHEMLVRCDKAPATYCVFSAGDPVKNFDFIARKLREKPAVINDSFSITYGDFISGTLSSLYNPAGSYKIASDASDLYTLLTRPGVPATRARASLARRITEAYRAAPVPDANYDNGYEAFSSVLCTDGLHPADAKLWPALTAAADRRAPYFGRAWGWGSAQCARNSWTVRDEDAYTGPFNRRTAAPVLVVGSYWDPATNYQEAVSSAALLPNSRLLSSTNWGHTAYGTSACATGAIDAYLLRGTLPAKGTTCVGDKQPYTELPEEDFAGTRRADGAKADLAAAGRPAAGAAKELPPVVVRVPVSVLNGTR